MTHATGRDDPALAETAWPLPDAGESIEWQLRYGSPDRSAMLAAAGGVAAYGALVADGTTGQQTRRLAPLRIQILSDLHLEFYRDGGKAFTRSIPVAGDVLVLAGDLLPLRDPTTVSRVFSWFCDRFAHVVFVPGNHEYYRTRPTDADALLAAFAHDNLHIINPGVTFIDGVRFVGATLWFPPTTDEAGHRDALNDFRLISGFVPWVHQTHAAHLDFLAANVHRGDVVVTHHLPHSRSIAPQYAGSPLNRFFLAEDASDLVELAGAQLWIHGHTHTSCDYVVGETRVVCNPRGYPSETGGGFDSGFVVEVLKGHT